ncbi:MAG: hypothetical protein ACREO1_02690 [Arenimonas sp.]
MISKLCLLVILFSAPVVTAADHSPQTKPQPGSYGFNWLDANSRCKKLTAKDLVPIKKCTISNNAFGLELKSHVCKVNHQIELIVYKNAAECQQALETMQANGP